MNIVSPNKEVHVNWSDRFLAVTFLKVLPKRVTPNQITIFRFFTVPFVAYFVYRGIYLPALILFAISAFTDALDGALARTTNRITEWGKTFDPLADKILIGLTTIMLVPRYLGINLAIVILAIDMLLIGSAYFFKNTRGKHIRANWWGKIKMILQSLGVSVLLLYAVVSIPIILLVAQYLLYASVIFAVISAVTYIL